MRLKKAKRIQDIPTDFLNKLASCNASKPYLGTDPEFFIMESATGKILSADKFFPDSKHALPVNYEDCANNLFVFFDGIQAEINVPASACREIVSSYIRTCLMFISDSIGKAHTICTRPSARIQKAVIKGAHRDARMFGCMPDFNAYTGMQNTFNIDAEVHPYRYAGGHIHIGVTSNYLKKNSAEFKLAKTEEGHIRAVKFFDYISGVILVLMDKGADSKRRRSTYGKAGCFRPTPYGIEYRTPSCWWIKSPATMSLIFGLVRLAWELMLSDLDKEFMKHVGYDEEEVRGIIDESDVKEAKKFWQALRPFIAISSTYSHNPLNVRSLRTNKKRSIESAMMDNMEQSELINTINNNYMPSIASGGRAVYALAAFEYMVRHGADTFISDDIKKEWCFSSDNKYYNEDGFVNQMYTKLFDTTKKVYKIKDFIQFQRSVIKTL